MSERVSTARERRQLENRLIWACAGQPVAIVLPVLCNVLAASAGVGCEEIEEAERLLPRLLPLQRRTLRRRWQAIARIRVTTLATGGGW